MGQSQSTKNAYKFPPAVQTRDELTGRHAEGLMDGITYDGGRWFEEVFNTFCDRSKSTTFWSEKSLATCLQKTLPQELTATSLEAIPVIHRFLRRLGSFPYQNDPEELLTQRVLSVAIYLLSTYLDDAIDLNMRDYGARFCFQSLASLTPRKRDKSLRDEADDEDLINVLSNSRGKRRQPGNPKVLIRGPEPPPPSHFPSSWSSDMDQLIPIDEFQYFLHLMVVLNLYNIGFEAEDFTIYIPQVEKVTDCLLAAFQAGSNGISWDSFSQVYTYDMPCLFLGLGQLLSLLVYYRPLPQGKYPFSAEEMPTFFEISYKPSVRREVPSPGYIFSLPILSQLRIMLPRYLLFHGVSVDLTVRNDQMDLGKLVNHIIQKPPIVLLVSGSSQGQEVIFGLSYPGGSFKSGAGACIFQLEPVHRIFRTPPLTKNYSHSIKVRSDDDKKPTLVASTVWERKSHGSAVIDKFGVGHNLMSLVVSEEGFGQFTVERELFPRIEEHFSVDAIELLKCDHQEFIAEDFDY